MDLRLYYTSDENNKINKALSNALILTGTMRDSSSIINPVILVEGSSFGGYNYAYIPQFDRYYFIKGITNYRNNLWILELECDVLMSFKSSILNMHCIFIETESAGADRYLADSRVWVAKVKDKTDIISFPNGLLENGEYILITAGG